MAKKSLQQKGTKTKRGFNPRSIAALKKTAIKPGEVRNPNGGRTHNPLVKAFNKINQDNYREALQHVLDSDESTLDDFCDDPAVSSMTKLIAVSMREAIRLKDFGLLERITERLFGKVPDQLDLTAKTKATSVDRNVLKEALKELKDEF